MALSFKKVKIAMDIVLKAGHVPNIVGLQGIGKSDLVREYAKENGYAYREITCSLLQEGDLAMPYLAYGNDGKGGREVEYAVSTIITSLHEEMHQEGTKGILFLDEFNRGSSQVQSEMMNLVLQREVVGYKLDKDVMIVLAMNPSSEMEGYEDTDYSVSYSDNAMLGRVCTLNLKPILSDWLEYGERVIPNGGGRSIVHPLIRSFLSSNGSYFVTKEQSGRVNNTPRGWSRASDILYSYEESGISNKDILQNLMEGTLDKECIKFLVAYVTSKNANSKNYRDTASKILAGKFDLLNGYKLMSDVDLDNVFKMLVEKIYDMGDVPTDVEERFVDYMLYANKALSYSWVMLMSKEYDALYNALLESNTRFSNYILSLLSVVNERESGGFSGK